MTKTPLLLAFAAACAATPKHPLCDHDGAPACGNVGQAGRALAAKPTLRPEVKATEDVARPPIRRALLVPRSVPQSMSYASSPLVNASGEPSCGNVMTKGGPTKCR